MDDYYALTSVLSYSIPFVTLSREPEEEEQNDQFMMTPTERGVAAPHIPGLVTSQRPGETDKSPGLGMPPMKHRVSFERPPQERSLDIICHECYDLNHYAPDCDLLFRHQKKVIQIYEQLTQAEKMSIPTMSYHCVHTILGAEVGGDKPYHSSSHSPTPYPMRSKYCDLI